MSGKVEPCASNLCSLSTLSCDICHKHFNGRKPYYEHLQSNNHQKKLKEKALLDTASQEGFNPHLKVLQSDEVYKGKNVGAKSIVGDLQYKKLTGNSENKTQVPATWNYVDSPVLSTLLPNEKECEQFYDECAICQLYFTSRKSASMHFNGSEHKRKVAHHKEIEELYNSVKNVDIQEVVENLCMPSLNPLEKSVKSKVPNTTTVSSKQRTLEVSGTKLPPLAPLDCNKFNEKKLQPACEICGITSFPSVIHLLNHLSTTEHCRKAAMQAEAERLNSNISNKLSFISSSIDTNQKSAENSVALAPTSHIVSSDPDYLYRTCYQEKKTGDNTSLNPIGYERKQKQHQQSTYYPPEKSLCLPEMYYSFDYYDKASAASPYLSEVLSLDPVSQKYKTPVDNDLSPGGQYLLQQYISDLPQNTNISVPPQMHASKPFPRLAATFPKNDVEQNLFGIEIINPDQDFSF